MDVPKCDYNEHKTPKKGPNHSKQNEEIELNNCEVRMLTKSFFMIRFFYMIFCKISFFVDL